MSHRTNIRLACLTMCLASGLAISLGAAPTSGPASQPSSPPASRPGTTDFEASDPALRGQVGTRVVVTGTVASAELSKSGSVFRIQFKDSKASGFNAVVFKSKLHAFTAQLGENLTEALVGKRVEITGTVEEYRGNPQIILGDPTQLRVLP